MLKKNGKSLESREVLDKLTALLAEWADQFEDVKPHLVYSFIVQDDILYLGKAPLCPLSDLALSQLSYSVEQVFLPLKSGGEIELLIDWPEDHADASFHQIVHYFPAVTA